jgi:hypothetical protein
MTDKHNIQSLLYNMSLLIIACARMGAQLILCETLPKKKYDRPLPILLMKSVLATGRMLLMLAGHLAALSPLSVVDGRVADILRRLMRPNSFSPLPRKPPLSFGLKCLVMRTPICKHTVRKHVEVICGKRPSRNWIYAFLKRNPSITLTKASGLDPKRAKAFNQPVAKRYLDELLRLVEKYNIPIGHIYSMDEKGCQHGSGRKGTFRKYFYGR